MVVEVVVDEEEEEEEEDDDEEEEEEGVAMLSCCCWDWCRLTGAKPTIPFWKFGGAGKASSGPRLR